MQVSTILHRTSFVNIKERLAPSITVPQKYLRGGSFHTLGHKSEAFLIVIISVLNPNNPHRLIKIQNKNVLWSKSLLVLDISHLKYQIPVLKVATQIKHEIFSK